MKFVEYSTRESMMDSISKNLIEDLRAEISQNGTASIAVPGGTTPGPIFDRLSATDLDWEHVTILLGDERWVSTDHERSNTKLLNERLLTDYAAKATYLSLYTGDADPQVGAAKASTDVAELAPLSIALLGMGADMHTASLFPRAHNLEIAIADDAPAVVPISGGGATEPRVSLSLPILRSAKIRHIVITGIEKRDALNRAKEINNPMDAPISAVLDGSIIHWAE